MQPSRPASFKRTSRRGIALIMVLMVLVLITVLVVGFLSLVTTERQASSGYAEGNRSRMLSDSAINLVIGQIRQATETLNADPANPKTWASQPGMIRVYGSTGGAGNGRTPLSAAYKLYSSDQMRVTTFGQSEANAEAPPASWSAQRALYTDLNEPVEAQGRKHYPILEPPAVGEVEGYEVVNAPGTGGSEPVMPVKWLYLLRDGTVAAAKPVAGSDSKVTVAGASADNPVVGRLAFWTDDESSKVNINTASEGVFWDIPRANTVAERRLGNYLPARNEFQRYPGHPATTSLSVVLGKYFTSGGGSTTGNTTDGTSQYGLYYDLAPRVATGGSLDGTRTPSGAMVITKDQDRLYATVDEYFFKNAALANGRREVSSARLNPEVLAKTQFFLTAQSRAPEVTLFNTPRISLWPLQAVQPAGSTTARNAYDKLIAFCTSLGKDKALPATYPADQATGYSYAFQRKQVCKLLDSGSGNMAGWTSGNPTADYAQITRNQTLYAYLQRLTGREIPGFGQSFLAKYPNDRDQILTECFDYTRSLVNAISTPRKNLTPHYSYSPHYMAFGTVSPTKIGSTMGQGRFFTIAQAALLFYPTEVDVNPTDTTDVQTRKMRARLIIQPYCVSPGASAFNQAFRVRVTGMGGFQADSANLGLNAASSGNSLNMTFNEGYYASGSDFGPANKTALPTFNAQFFASSAAGVSRPHAAGSGANQFDVWASVADIDVAGKQTFTFTGGTITVEVFPPDYSAVVQTLKIELPGQTLPVPKRTGGLQDAGKQAVSGTPNRYTLDYRNRFVASFANQNTADSLYGRGEKFATILMDNMIYPGDTVHAAAVNPAGKARGDLRMIAYRSDVTADYFASQPNRNGASLRVGVWTNKGQFRKSWTEYFKNSEAGGKLVANLSYPETAVPMVPPGLNGALNQYDAPGDWDTGYDLQEDGPYVNKADEASTTLGYFNRGTGLGYVSAGGESGGYGSQGSEVDNITYSPNRQIASAVMFGSLPTGVNGKTAGRPEPWQTLLFTPQPAAGTQHYGLRFPQDHLWLDLFWMPIVEPYAISEPFSTAGKINMNYEIMPFRHVKRRTALHALLKGTSMTAIPDAEVGNYKAQTGTTYAANYRLEIDPDHLNGTLKGFENRFASGDIFRSASEICTISLVPRTNVGPPSYPAASYSTMETWWESHRLTGDNLRESPYNQLYPRLTTRSNTYNIHLRVQSLRKSRAGDPSEWDEDLDLVGSEYRGSCLIERYVDPNDPELPDFASPNDLNANGTADNEETLDQYYQYRIVQRRQFSP
ncbi:Verru_Chthon cassette protein A [Verrucomicrobium spinosum]|uniref:Verru_Chthon cassette protein A n=1 Tax=Verrucomicrobium spinosum TaxID=2736 RepID=UPI0012F6D85A|nr:Verru_Chthon cassette protein A [Verrucomicrobium spinosum]